MKILALIPARGGSKRLPGKNTKNLGGLPLIGWTIRAAQKSGCCSEIVVSTDDPNIERVSREFGATVPWLRPRHLSSDTASSVDVAIHFLDWYESENGLVDGLLLLQPTSPFRTAETILQAVNIFISGAGSFPCVSVSPANSHPAWCFRLTDSGMSPYMGWDNLQMRSQDLDSAWELNGSIYLISPERLRAEKKFLTADTKPIITNEWAESIDIDDYHDWALAESILLASSPEAFP
jgi:N-acylneuraminate cytidylyltransferase/CMP-N,N'-diacetyllegionaminic acid synthase